jgi:hypothetical protein
VSNEYGSHRWVLRDVRAPRVSLGDVSAGSGQFVIELLPTCSDIADGLPVAERPSPDIGELVQLALAAIAVVEDLAATVGSLVRACHVLAADTGYDISHSTPELPLSIFVSVPSADEPDAVLRLAESIIHEAMHLQLTLIESTVPLVQSTGGLAFSPWKQTARPVQGLLHGLYVFAVIDEALAALAAVAPEARDFANRRRAEIASEVAIIGDGRGGLTSVGVALWDRLIAGVGSRRVQHKADQTSLRSMIGSPGSNSWR